MEASQPLVPRAFIWRRLHSIAGIWLSVYLIFHIFTNSQSALFLGDDGKNFIHAVNAIQDIPYLPVIEFAILGLPILVHMILGIKYALNARFNSHYKNEKTAYLPYERNRAYTWQRITSWLLLIGLTFHIVQMRFIDHPILNLDQGERSYLTRVEQDPGLESVASRLKVKLHKPAQLATDFQPTVAQKIARKWSFSANQQLASAKDFGTAELLVLRETFKSVPMMIFYTLFILAAAFHGYNGLWTFLITWGVTPVISQRLSLRVSQFIMLTVAGLGLASIWLTYWVNLKT